MSAIGEGYGIKVISQNQLILWMHQPSGRCLKIFNERQTFKDALKHCSNPNVCKYNKIIYVIFYSLLYSSEYNKIIYKKFKYF